MESRIAVYAGTFDPITVGHLWVIKQSLLIFDKVVVAIGVNPKKTHLFTQDERLEMIQEAVKGLVGVEVLAFDNSFLVDYAALIGARFLIRGIRDTEDFIYERDMRNFNEDLNKNIMTVFLIPPHKLSRISSSLVKGLTGPEGWEDEKVRKYLPPFVFKKLKERGNAEPK